MAKYSKFKTVANTDTEELMTQASAMSTTIHENYSSMMNSDLPEKQWQQLTIKIDLLQNRILRSYNEVQRRLEEKKTTNCDTLER
jgi:hypothetical protein